MPNRPPTRTEALMEHVRARIAARALAPGDRLPSIRGLAAQMKVSPSTVVEAYDRLAAEGAIFARRGAGFYVAARVSAAAPLAPPVAPEVSRPRNVDPFWVSRQSLDAAPGALQPGCGWLPEDWMPQAALRRGLRAMARAEAPLVTNYAPARGGEPLRRWLAGRLAEDGLQVGLEQVMLTASASQALDLICRFLLRPGDVVLVDDPGYFNFQALLRAHRVEIRGVPRTPEGPDLAAFEAALAAAPRLYITNAALHNPTGGTLAPHVAHRQLALAEAKGLTIVEDEVFGDFEPERSPRLGTLDGLRRVLKIGGFSKTVSASARCGWIAGRADWIEALTDLQVATSFGGPSPVAVGLVHGVVSAGGWRRHLDGLHRRLAAARRDAAARLAPLGIEPWLTPRGGFQLWCRFPEGIDTGPVAQRCMAEGVILAPGDVFSVSRACGGFMRFNVTQMEDPRILETLARAMR